MKLPRPGDRASVGFVRTTEQLIGYMGACNLAMTAFIAQLYAHKANNKPKKKDDEPKKKDDKPEEKDDE